MEILRQFKRMSLWDFIDLQSSRCYGCGDQKTYLIYLDEIKLRRIESISEGGNLKLKSLAEDLLREYKKELSLSPDFATEQEMNDFKYIVRNEV
jgi:hypothetical protein